MSSRPHSVAFAAVSVAALAGAGLVAQSAAAPSLSQVEQRARDARAREAVLTTDVSRYNARIRAVEARIAPVQARWSALNTELTGLRAKRQALTAELETEQRRLTKLIGMLKVQRGALSARLSAAYRAGEPTVLQVLLASGSVSDAAAIHQNLERIAEQDRRLIVETKSSADASREARVRIGAARAEVFRTEQRVAAAEAEAAQALSVISAERNRLVAARSARSALLSRVTADRRELEAEARGLRARSAALANQIRAGSSNLPATVARQRQRPVLVAGQRADHLRLRPAVGPHARGHRHRRRPRARRSRRARPAPSSSPAGAAGTATSWSSRTGRSRPPTPT